MSLITASNASSDCPRADKDVAVRLVGSVLGHEQRVLSHLQQQLQQSHIRLMPTASAANAAVTIVFHRVKSRLPNDELASILAATAGKYTALHLLPQHTALITTVAHTASTTHSC